MKAQFILSGALILTLSACQSVQPQTAVGKYAYGSEAETFTPCYSNSTYWLKGNKAALKPLREKAIDLAKLQGAPFQPVYIELEYVDLGKAEEGFEADYASVIKLKKAAVVTRCP